MRLRAAALAGALLLGAAVVPARAHTGADRRPGATQFDLEVKLSRPNQPAYDSRVVADAFGNLYAVARKVTPASPDDRLTTVVRTAAWRWWSPDGGATWQALNGLPGELDARLGGGEPDVAVDGTNHVYVLDGPVVTRYAASKLGAVAYDGVGVVPATSPTQVAAHGDGTVFVLAGATLYVSRDGGATFGTQGHELARATGCRLATGPAKTVYATCIGPAGTVTFHASTDDGATFTTRRLTTAPDLPPVAVTPDGTVYVLRPETAKETTLWLMRSADGGRTWTQRRATYEHELMTHLSLTAAPDGRLGAAAYISAAAGERWFVGAGIFAPDKPFLVVSFADHTPVAQRGQPPPQGAPDVSFLPDSRLALTWTVVTSTLPTDGTTPLLRDAWFVRSQRPDAHSETPDLTRTPAYDIPPCTIEGQVVRVADWQQVKAPAFRTRDGGAGPELVAYAVDPFQPRTVYAANGTTLMRSDDGGCRWREVFSLEPSPSQDMPVSAAAGRVVAVTVPEDRREHATVYVVLSEGDRAHVVRSKNGEPGTFALADNGLPPAGGPGVFRVAADNPEFLYLTSDNLLYASEDAGATWSLRTSPADAVDAGAYTALTVDPKGPNNLYAVRGGTLRHSRDGGRTWTAPVPPAGVTAAAGEVSAVDVFHADGERARVTAWSVPAGSKPAVVLRSADDGATWTREAGTGLEGPVESAAHGSGPDVLVVSTLPVNDGSAEIYRRDRKTKAYADLAPVETQSAFHVTADRRGHPTFYAMGPGAIYRYAGDAIEPPTPPGFVDDSVFTEITPYVAPPVVTPEHRDVTLLVGESATLPFAIDVAPRKPRIDVMLLADTSESMTDALPSLRRDLLAALTRLSRRADVWVGVAQAKTDAAPPVYRRERDVGPFDASVGAALDRLDPRNGSGLETQLIGLQQLATGAGMDACPVTTAGGRTVRGTCLDPPVGSLCEVQPDTAGCAVRPGQQANWRDATVKVVVHATDTTFRNPEGTPRRSDGTIDIGVVADEYREHGVLQLGLAVHPEGIPDLATMAALTGAVGPEGGLDCDGDGRADVAPGRPAVCPDASRLDGVLYALARAHTPRTHVHAEPPEGTPPSPVLARITPEEFEDVDRTVAQHLVGTVTVSCKDVAPGHYDVALRAEVHDEKEAGFGVGVDCVVPAVPSRPRLPGVVPPLVPPVAPAPPAHPLPNVNPQAQAQPQAQVQPQAGAATQERDQVQPMLAEVDAESPVEVPAALVELAGMLGVSAGAAYALQRRAQQAREYVRLRR